MAKPLVIIPLYFLCVSAASGQEAPIPKDSKDSNIILTCRPQKPLSHTWICVDQFGRERMNLKKRNEATPYIPILDRPFRKSFSLSFQKILVLQRKNS
jgi:hypothetical protein